ncbi:hypothetical protein EPYR_00847 [Erwinia pyrifoliae DSM 12163]|nr:hypothetical protein EPYR_00847 [Erwinia pyrifoliae DSM 12163]
MRGFAIISVPRVSGDKPFMTLIIIRLTMCSPRERG